MTYYPKYGADRDYTTNAPSYYEDLARKNELMKHLAKRVWEFDKKLFESLEEVQRILDETLRVIGEGFNEEIEKLLIQWVEDGTLDHIINVTLMNKKADITYVDSELEKLSDHMDETERKLHDQIVEAVQSMDDKISDLRSDLSWHKPKTAGDGITDDYGAIQNAIDTYPNVYLPQGDYRLSKQLKVREGTHLWMHKKARLIRAHTTTMISNYDDHSTGWEGIGNFIIEGGILDCNPDEFQNVGNGIGITHGHDIILRNVEIRDLPSGSGHAIEIGGSRDILIDGCRLVGFKPDGNFTGAYSEAIQVETLQPPGDGWTYPYITDYTSVKNVTIQNCYFGPSEKYPAHPCGVGTHGGTFGKFFENIKILNNTFEGFSYFAVRPFKFTNCLIQGNTFRGGIGAMGQVGGGISAQTPTHTNDSNGNQQGSEFLWGLHIKDNTFFNLEGRGIWLRGADSSSKYRDVIISGNVFRAIQSHGIVIDHVKGVDISNNTFQNIGMIGMNIVNAEDLTISNNIISTIADNALFLKSSRYVTISHNLMEFIDLFGMNISGDNNFVQILFNNLRNCSKRSHNVYDAIIVSTGANQVDIIGNKVRNDLPNKQRHALNIQTGVTNGVRWGNDLRSQSATSNLADGSVFTTTTDDLI